MKKLLLLTFILSFSFLGNTFALFKPVENLESAQIKRVAISELSSEVIYVASKNSLYKSENKGKTFKKIAVFRDEEVQHIFLDAYLADTVYVVTTRHFYRVNQRTEPLYVAADDQVIYTALKHKGNFFIGTSQGLYSGSEGVLAWRKLKVLSDFSVYSLDFDKNNIYLATDKGVYSFNEKDNFQRLFVMNQDSEGQEQTLTSRFIKVDTFDQNILWLGTNRGIFVSYDKGLHWKKLYLTGIDDVSVNCLVQTRLENNNIYLGTTRGLFKVDFKRNISKQIFEGVYSSYIWWIEFDSVGKMYLATTKGLFENDYFTAKYRDKGVDDIFLTQPSIGEIQQAALRYNEVHPDKIKEWRNSLKYRALLPSVGVDYDKTINYDSGSDKYYIGPRDWGISFSWDIADLVWDTYQDDVDTRARLNTQLRLDILAEINRVYFERIRLIKEINSSSSKEYSFNSKLRLEELTAIIDGYTGGYCSKRARELNEAR